MIEHSAEHYQAAEGYYRLALGIDPNYTPALYNLALVRTQLGGAGEAMDLYRKVLSIEPNNPNALYYLGILLVNNGKVDEGKQMLQRAVEINPKLVLPAGQ